MTETEKRIAALIAERDRRIEYIQFCQQHGSTRDEEHASDNLRRVEIELRRLVTNGNGNAAQERAR